MVHIELKLSVSIMSVFLRSPPPVHSDKIHQALNLQSYCRWLVMSTPVEREQARELFAIKHMGPEKEIRLRAQDGAEIIVPLKQCDKANCDSCAKGCADLSLGWISPAWTCMNAIKAAPEMQAQVWQLCEANGGVGSCECPVHNGQSTRGPGGYIEA